jgi:glycerophosphoryl diester phosphodiesterase
MRAYSPVGGVFEGWVVGVTAGGTSEPGVTIRHRGRAPPEAASRSVLSCAMRPGAWPIAWLGISACGGTTSAEGVLSEATSTSTSASSSESTEGHGESDTEAGATETETGDTDEPPGNLLLSDQQLNIAHRGGGRLRPEATLPAFEHALSVGADVIEFDVQASSDGVVVVIHDDTVDRTTDGSGAVSGMSFAELRMLDAGYDFTPDDGQTFPYRGMGIQIPTLDEVLEAFPDQYYLIEIKQYEPSIVPEVLASLEAHSVLDRVVIASFQQVTIDAVRAANPELFTAMTLPEMVEFYGASEQPGYRPPALFVQAPWDIVDQPLVDFAHSLGLEVQPWTVNSEPLMHDLIALGVDGIMTDDPELLEAALGE